MHPLNWYVLRYGSGQLDPSRITSSSHLGKARGINTSLVLILQTQHSTLERFMEGTAVVLLAWVTASSSSSTTMGSWGEKPEAFRFRLMVLEGAGGG